MAPRGAERDRGEASLTEVGGCVLSSGWLPVPFPGLTWPQGFSVTPVQRAGDDVVGKLVVLPAERLPPRCCALSLPGDAKLWMTQNSRSNGTTSLFLQEQDHFLSQACEPSAWRHFQRPSVRVTFSAVRPSMKVP